MVFHVDTHKRRQVCRREPAATTYRSHAWDLGVFIIFVVALDGSLLWATWGLTHGGEVMLPSTIFVVSCVLLIVYIFWLCGQSARVGEVLRVEDRVMTYRYVNGDGAQLNYVARLDECGIARTGDVILISGAVTLDGEPVHCMYLFDWFEPSLCDVLVLGDGVPSSC